MRPRCGRCRGRHPRRAVATPSLPAAGALAPAVVTATRRGRPPRDGARVAAERSPRCAADAATGGGHPASRACRRTPRASRVRRRRRRRRRSCRWRAAGDVHRSWTHVICPPPAVGAAAAACHCARARSSGRPLAIYGWGDRAVPRGSPAPTDGRYARWGGATHALWPPPPPLPPTLQPYKKM